MGTISSIKKPDVSCGIGFKCRSKSDIFFLDDENGFVFYEKIPVPEEIISLIISYMPAENILSCRLVCKSWCNIIDTDVWKLKNNRLKIRLSSTEEFPWQASYLLHSRLHLFGVNLIKNSCGEEKLDHWDMISNGGDHWLVEKPPEGCEDNPDFPEYSLHGSCFVTSFYSCSKEQVIDLTKIGATSHFMDLVKPRIYIREWYCGRFDCRSIYEILIALLTQCHSVLDDFSARKNVGAADGWSWEFVEHEFHDYAPGVRRIKFYHGGVDQQFWKGHYGSKMTGACVMFKLPSSTH